MPVDDLKERARAIEMAVGQIEKQFGKGSIMRLGQKDAVAIPSISTGSISLDYALGRRRRAARPRDRDLRPGVLGQDDAGAAGDRAGAEAGRHGGVRRRRARARRLVRRRSSACDLEDLLVSQPDNGEQALEIVEVLVRSGSVDVVVVDSVAALVPRAEIEGEMGDAAHGPAGAADVAGAAQAHRRRLQDARPASSSSTSCARRSASCSATPRRRPAAAR